MKLLLIAPSSGKWEKVAKSTLFNGKTFRFSLLSLLSVAAECPADTKIKIIDEQVENIPWNEHFDLVGITCMTALAPRAYEISAKFRKKKIPVVLGGIHPTLCPEDACRYADAVVVGDAEGIWQTVLVDAGTKTLKPIYRQHIPPDLWGIRPIPNTLLDRKFYSTIHAVQATRGCPNNCSFCSVTAFHKHGQRKRPVDEVVKEVARIPEKFFILVDDNLTADQAYAKQLFEGLAPLKKLWASQSSLTIADTPHLVELAAESGCIGLFVGIETFSNENLTGVDKSCNQVENYKAAIQMFHKYGIIVEAGVVFGFDNDRYSGFENTLTFLDELEVDLIQASIFTPLPGTPPHSKLKSRIFDLNWKHYDFHSTVFHPKHMSAQDLQNGHDWVTREFYRPMQILRRLKRHALRPRGIPSLQYLATVNLAYYGRVLNWNIRGQNPALSSDAVTGSGHDVIWKTCTARSKGYLI